MSFFYSWIAVDFKFIVRFVGIRSISSMPVTRGKWSDFRPGIEITQYENELN
jgi:hypothetical protein